MDPRVELVEKAMQLIGGRWKPAIMFCLNLNGTHRFSELGRVIPGVSQRMLTKQLRDLERHGLITRVYAEEIPPRVEYSSTDLGKSLHPIYKSVCDWAGINLSRPPTAVANEVTGLARKRKATRPVR
jgi:DNA-binding HxlR family transcriptional regulator